MTLVSGQAPGVQHHTMGDGLGSACPSGQVLVPEELLRGLQILF